MTQPTIARGAPQTDAEMIAALEQHIENYRIACEGFEYGARVAAERITALEAERNAAEDRVRVLEAQLSETHRKIANQRDANRRLTEDAQRRNGELAALKAERDAYRSQFWDNALPELTEMRKQRDDARAAFNVMDGCYKQAVAERDSETRWAHHYFTAWQTARQSRARLVRLVRAKNGEFNHLMKLWGEARAWAAAWKRAATFWRGWRDMPYTYCRDRDFVFGGARRAAEAAEAMERR